MVNRARIRFPEVNFACCDVIGAPECAGGDYDIVYSAGIFNLAATSSDAFLRTAFDAFCGLAGQHVAISLLNVASESREDTYRYFRPEDVLRDLARPGWELRVIDGYLQNDFTLIATRL